MKKFILAALLILPFVAFSQMDKIGYSKTQVINSTEHPPIIGTVFVLN